MEVPDAIQSFLAKLQVVEFTPDEQEVLESVRGILVVLEYRLNPIALEFLVHDSSETELFIDFLARDDEEFEAADDASHDPTLTVYPPEKMEEIARHYDDGKGWKLSTIQQRYPLVRDHRHLLRYGPKSTTASKTNIHTIF
jgi:hypothetical protein